MVKTLMSIVVMAFLAACTNVQGNAETTNSACECCKEQRKCCGGEVKPGHMCPMKMKGKRGK